LKNVPDLSLVLEVSFVSELHLVSTLFELLQCGLIRGTTTHSLDVINVRTWVHLLGNILVLLNVAILNVEVLNMVVVAHRCMLWDLKEYNAILPPHGSHQDKDGLHRV